MKSTDIIYEWLSIAENRKKLTVMRVTEEQYQFIRNHADVLLFGPSNDLETTVFGFANSFFRIKVITPSIN